MTPRLSVTSVALFRPVILRTLFSLSLPFRYSATSTLMEIALHSAKPASGPSVSPVPRSTRKLNCPYGRSRRTAISASCSVSLTFVLEPDEVIERELELLVSNAAAQRVEGWTGPAARPRARQPPRIHDRSRRRGQLPD